MALPLRVKSKHPLVKSPRIGQNVPKHGKKKEVLTTGCH